MGLAAGVYTVDLSHFFLPGSLHHVEDTLQTVYSLATVLEASLASAAKLEEHDYHF